MDDPFINLAPDPFQTLLIYTSPIKHKQLTANGMFKETGFVYEKLARVIECWE